MFVKVLLIGLAAAALYFLGRLHARRRAIARTSPPPRSAPLPRTTRWGGWLALMLFPLLLAGIVYHHWQEERRVVRVKVINIQSGVTMNYRARQHEIQLRTFQELDGRRILLADQERMEVEPLLEP